VIAAVGSVLWLAIGVGSQSSQASSGDTAAPPHTTTTVVSARPTERQGSSGESSTTEYIDPDEAHDPAAEGATAPAGVATLTPSTSTACRAGDPLANVYHPDRLTVIQPCLTVTGTVTGVEGESDGDYHVLVMLDPPFAALVNDRNGTAQNGALVVEIVPADGPDCTPGQPPRPSGDTYDYGVCTGANVASPAVGAHVTVTGPYVLDRNHGWMEIHPAWAIEPIGATSTTTAMPPTTQAPPSTVSPPPDCTPGYSPCIPPGPDVDCAGGTGDGPRYVQGPVIVTGSDPYGLDRDGDGVGCE
jgi:hypothetical protein